MATKRGKDHPFFKKAENSPEVVAHRGGGGEWPEETIYAFRHAIDLGVDILEMDVQMTSDGELVLMHNEKVDETTNGKGKVKNLRWEDLKELNAAASWGTADEYKNIRIPRLEDVFKEFPNARMNIEIKQNNSEVVAKLGDLIMKSGMADQVLVASLWGHILRKFRKLYKEVAISASILQVAGFNSLGTIFDGDGIPNMDAIQWKSRLITPLITKKFVKRAHDSNLVLHGWTVNDPTEMDRLRELEVDGIITDFPTTLLKILGRPVNT